MPFAPYCPHCKSTQLDYASINMDAYKCRKCGKYATGLEMLKARERGTLEHKNDKTNE